MGNQGTTGGRRPSNQGTHFNQGTGFEVAENGYPVADQGTHFNQGTGFEVAENGYPVADHPRNNYPTEGPGSWDNRHNLDSQGMEGLDRIRGQGMEALDRMEGLD